MRGTSPGVSPEEVALKLGEVIRLEDATEYTHASPDSTWVLKKTWVAGVVVPAGEVWILDGFRHDFEMYVSANTWDGKARILLNDIVLSTTTTQLNVYTAFTGGGVRYSTINLEAGSYDVKFEIWNQLDARTTYVKNQLLALAFRKYRG